MNIASLHNAFGWFSLVEENGQITQLLWEDRSEGFRSDVLKEGLNQLEAYFAGNLTQFDLPLAPAGTDFQQQVYRIMQDIPFGEVLTYGEVATRLGEPGAARAVGQALGRNPFAPVVPCHRVLAAGDKPGGFSATGGIRTKLRLLIIEGAMRGTPGLFD